MRVEARRGGTAVLWLAVLSWCAVPESAGAVEQERHGRDLETLQERIRGARTELQTVQEQQTALLAKLVSLEDRARIALSALEQVRGELREQHARLEGLEPGRAELLRQLAVERIELAARLRWTHRVSRGRLLRFTLGLEAPRRVGRTLAYYHYLNLRRVRIVRQLRENLRRAVEVRFQLQQETEAQAAHLAKYEARLAALQELRTRRNAHRTALQETLSERHRELAALLREEQVLLRLLEGIGTPLPPPIGEALDFQPFDSLRGRLQWPAVGPLTRAFGARDARSGLRSSGVLITTEAGAGVRAVSAGEVVFADHFQNLGLLLILDHGDGYMSLYAQNRELLGKLRQKVRTGEIIAYNGTRGGAGGGALYFEIRHQGVALDPARWCSR